MKMKNVLLGFSIVLLPFLSNAQATFLTQSGTSDSVSGSCSGTAGCASLGIENAIRSATPTPVTIQWRMISKSLGVNWKLGGFCDNITCYGPAGVDSGNMYTSLPYDSNSRGGVFHPVFDASTAASGTSSWIKMNVRDPNSGYSRVLTFIGMKNSLGVTTSVTSTDDVLVYPIPASDAVNVVFNESAGVRTIAVYNLIGKLMGPVYKPASNGSAKISVADMPNGIYFLRLMDASGRVVATRRFTHQ